MAADGRELPLDPRQLARVMGIGRLALGVALIATPQPLLRGWLGDDAEAPGGRILAFAVGARGIALATGTLAALRDGKHADRWLRVTMFADAGDFLATALIRPRGTRAGRILLLASAATNTAFGGWLQAQLR